jgi:hypothetical protein
MGYLIKQEVTCYEGSKYRLTVLYGTSNQLVMKVQLGHARRLFLFIQWLSIFLFISISPALLFIFIFDSSVFILDFSLSLSWIPPCLYLGFLCLSKSNQSTLWNK